MKKQPIRFRILTVIKALKERPMTWKELTQLGIPEKTLQRILQEYLIFWGLVQKHEDGYYSWYERKREFSKSEYELALQHSKAIIFGNKTMLGISKYTIDSLVNAYVMDREEVTEFFSHLKTGYPQIYKKFERCLNILKERGRLIKQIDKTKSKHDDLKVNYTLSRCVEVDSAPKEKLGFIEKKYEDALKDLAGELAIVFMQVKNGIPLEGYCPFCPHIRLKIKE